MKYFAVFLFIAVFSCKHRSPNAGISNTFDKTKWQIKDGADYPYRDIMLRDLMTNYAKHGAAKDSLALWLGTPDRTDSNYLFYTVSQKRISGFPLSTKSIVVKLNGDTAEWVKIHE